ncbi:hypothetical protein HOLleu_11582 [Holothuria leucospilota]|uniref:Uncharacterized protein n=1 Tax=Holothuria leucospilota TaxID=206669 RepID=A0A9Q1CEY6_HOLLE|nr:hypothetical protein HOLleu_11582 [Holothuria leucospilota]
MVIDDVSAFTYGRTLRHGRLTYDLLSPDSVPSDSIRRRKNRNKKLMLNGWQSLLIVAHLEGGGGKRQEDETQLFFQDCSNQPDFCPLDITITLKPMEFLRCTCHLSRKLPPLRRTATERSRAVSCSTISGNTIRQSQSLRQPASRANNASWEEENAPSRIPSATPVVAELQPNNCSGDQLQMITQVGSIKRKKKKPPRLKKHGDKKTHPTSENVKTTEVHMQNTIATIAINDLSAGPSHGNVLTELAYASGKRQEQHGNVNDAEVRIAILLVGRSCDHLHKRR